MYRPSGKMVLGFTLSFLAGYFAVLLLITALLPVREPWKLLEPHDWELKVVAGVAPIIGLFFGGALAGMARVQSAIFGDGGPLYYFSIFIMEFAVFYLIFFAIGAWILGVEGAYGRELIPLAAMVSPIAGMIGNGIFVMICQMQEM